MKNWWKNLGPIAKTKLEIAVFLLIFFFVVAPLGVLLLIYINDTGAKYRVIYDSAHQEIKQDLSFVDWLKDRPGKTRYFFIPREISIVNIVSNVAYKAEFRLPKGKETVKKFLTEEMLSPHIALNDLKKSIEMCVGQIARRDYNIEGYPSITVRAMSIGNMNELCPVASRFGYEWSDKLEIVQCNGDLPLDNARQNDCLNSARFAHYL